MGEAFITRRGGHITANPSLNITIEQWNITAWHDATGPKSETKTYTLESAPSYITVTSNGTNSISNILYNTDLQKFNLPVSVSNGSTITLAGGSSGSRLLHRIDITLSGNKVILKHSALALYVDDEGNPASGGTTARAVLNLFVVGTM